MATSIYDMKEQDSSYAAMKAKFEENNFKVITPVGFYNILLSTVLSTRRARATSKLPTRTSGLSTVTEKMPVSSRSGSRTRR
jgi:hypothetical protein